MTDNRTIQPPPPKEGEEIEEKESSSSQPLNITSENFPKFIHIRFYTTTCDENVGNQVYEVPSHLTRYGLSELVNHILSKKNPNRKIEPFEFLIPFEKDMKVFLRTSLQQFFLKVQKWPETLTLLEYVSSQPPPKNTDTIPHNDWVSVIRHVLPTMNVNNNTSDGITDLLVSGCYDGIVRIWDPKTLQMISQYRYFSSLSDMDVIPLGGTTHHHHHLTSFSPSTISPFDLLMLCCGKTEYAHVISYHHDTKSIIRQKILTGHAEKVNCVRIQSLIDRTVYITGSNDKSIKLYFSDGTENSNQSDEDEEEEEEGKRKKKRRKLETKKPTFSLFGHRLAVKCLEFDTQEKKLFSGSDDHTVKVWDLENQKLVTSLAGSKVISSLSYQPSSGLALSAHPDYLIRMWDTRAKTPPRVFRSHKGWVRSVDWANKKKSETGFRFVSGGDDNQIKIWDIRSAIPICSIPHHVSKKKRMKDDEDEDDDEEEEEEELWTLSKKRNPFERNRHKVLCVRYGENSDNVFFSGSTDCTLKRNVMKSGD